MTLGVTTALLHWLNVTEDLDGLIEVLSSDATGHRLEPSQVAAALVSTGVTLDRQLLGRDSREGQQLQKA